MSNLVLSINKGSGEKQDITLTGNVIYHEVFNTQSELNNSIGYNGVSEAPEYLYFNTTKLGEATHCIIYSPDINEDNWKVQVNQSAHASGSGGLFNVSGAVRGNIISTEGEDGFGYEETWCKFGIADENIWGDKFNYVEDVPLIGGSEGGDGLCNTLSFETKNLLTVVPLWNIVVTKLLSDGELIDQLDNARFLGIRVENGVSKQYRVILFQDTTLGNDIYAVPGGV